MSIDLLPGCSSSRVLPPEDFCALRDTWEMTTMHAAAVRLMTAANDCSAQSGAIYAWHAGDRPASQAFSYSMRGWCHWPQVHAHQNGVLVVPRIAC